MRIRIVMVDINQKPRVGILSHRIQRPNSYAAAHAGGLALAYALQTAVAVTAMQAGSRTAEASGTGSPAACCRAGHPRAAGETCPVGHRTARHGTPWPVRCRSVWSEVSARRNVSRVPRRRRRQENLAGAWNRRCRFIWILVCCFPLYWLGFRGTLMVAIYDLYDSPFLSDLLGEARKYSSPPVWYVILVLGHYI